MEWIMVGRLGFGVAQYHHPMPALCSWIVVIRKCLAPLGSACDANSALPISHGCLE